MRDWELVDSDRFSFEDSDRFEEDSLCSWISEPESLCNNWRGWKKSNFTNNPNPGAISAASTSLVPLIQSGCATGPSIPPVASSVKKSTETPTHLNLVELSAKCVASYIPFEMVERFYPPVPEQLQLRIAFWSFPEHEEDIRLYSCLANGSAEEFQKGERLFRNDSVSDILQIGFHLSATVKPNMREAHKVAVTFDRRRVTSCTCTCNASTNWCGHVAAVCLHRIFQSKDVMLRAPVSESLSRLHRDQLQKFAQYLISELPQQILPTAQRLLDELLSSQRSAINTLRGAPDPTAGASANEQTTWFLDERTLHGNIHKILIKFCVPAPIVFSDVNYLSSAAPPASAEWSSLLRPLRGREPEGMWNLLSIVREMFRREDRNAVPLLEIITEECLNCDQILVWWFNTKVALHNGNSGHGGKHHSVNSNAHACQHAGSSLCDEIVLLWRLAALNPGLSPEERCTLHNQFKEWHLKIIEKVSKSRNASVGSKHANSFKNDVEVFPGFRPSIEACYLNWDNYPIAGVTYSEASQIYLCPFMCFRHSDGHSRSGDTGMIHSSHAILNNPAGEHHLLHSSATISSVPLISKRPRSVDFGAERNSGCNGDPPKSFASTSAGASSSNPGPSTSGNCSSGKTAGKVSKNRKQLRDLNDDIVVPCMSASGLKIKTSRDASLDQSSFDDEIAGTSAATSSSSSRGRVVQPDVPLPRVERDGNRSSVSSEGFCENDNEVEVEVENESEELKDEGVETDPTPKLPLAPPSLNNTTTSDELEGEGEADLDADSDSSASARLSGVNLVPVIPPKFDSSDSQQSGDEYQLYYYDPKAPVGSCKKTDGNEDGNAKKDPMGLNVFANLKRIEDHWDVLFARAEGLHAHGHSKEACKLGVKLAGELLANPPDLTIDLPPVTAGKGKRKKINPVSHQVSCLASATLAKCGFLCTVLAENSEYYYLAFQVGMFGLELARPPASTKPLEVKLANQEAELAQLLKRIPIGQKELDMIRHKAESLRDGTFKSRGEALLPLVLANFIFDALVMPTNREARCSLQSGVYHLPTDESLGFEAAVSALGLKANVSEAEHPLLCEGTRRQRGDLALSMLLHYKDESDKLAKVMDKLLDREIHQLYKAPLPSAYYSNNPPTTTLLGVGNSRNDDTLSSSPREPSSNSSSPSTMSSLIPPLNNNNNASNSSSSSSLSSSATPASACKTILDAPNVATIPGALEVGEIIAAPVLTSVNSSVTASAPASANGRNPSTSGNGSQATSPSGGDLADSSSLTTSCGTSSSPPAASSATGNASATAGASSQNQNQTTQTATNSVPQGRSGKESGRFKGKRAYPVLPNQPSEAGAHFMFELAKIVLGKAGGSSNQSLFTQPSNGQNPRGPHRALHMCAFHIGLYALGLHNAVSPNWLSRTYSSHVSWITGQAMEIGAPAIAFLIDTWDSHLTPPEAVTIADRASRGDANMVRAAAELALSCLPYAHALNPNEIHRAILQCKEQSDGMLEKACLTVESAAKGGGVYPEVLFDVARQWYSLYQKHLPLDVDILNEELSQHESLLSLDSGLDPMNPNNHTHNHPSLGVVSLQTGLPPINPNNPPPPPPSCSSAGPSTAQSPMEMIQLPPQPSQLSHQHGTVYPMSSPQVPLATIPYTGSPYQVPFIPATFNPVPGNFVYGQTVIYQASASNNPGVATTTAAYYNQQPPPQGSQQPQPTYVTPSMHQQLSHSQHQGHQHPHQHHNHMVSAGPALQYYPSAVPITSAGPSGHIRQGPTQFFPVSHSHMSIMNSPNMNGNHHNPGVSQSNSSHVAAVVAAAAVSGHPVNVGVGMNVNMNGHVQHLTQHHQHMGNGPHLVAITNGGSGQPSLPQGPNGQQQMSQQQGQAQGAPNGQMMGGGNGHGMSHGGMNAMNVRAPGQPQVNCGNPMVNHNGGFVQGGQMNQQGIPNHPSGLPGIVFSDGPSTSTASQVRPAFFPHGGRDSVNMGNQHQQGSNGQSAIKVKYLLAAYRVGMLALETLARRVHDDRPQAKFARNPPYGEDVKWLLSIARKLGAQYLQQFCICAVSSIANPFVLHEIILDAALISTRNNLAWVYQNPRSPLAPLVQKCQQMYFQCLHQKLYHITVSDYEDFVSIVCTARQAFHLTPDGVSQFKEWLQNLRRSKACKKDLWAQITSALSTNNK